MASGASSPGADRKSITGGKAVLVTVGKLAIVCGPALLRIKLTNGSSASSWVSIGAIERPKLTPKQKGIGDRSWFLPRWQGLRGLFLEDSILFAYFKMVFPSSHGDWCLEDVQEMHSAWTTISFEDVAAPNRSTARMQISTFTAWRHWNPGFTTRN
ncbi:hypothetical protein OF83DRAFT_1085520 [Amylostereum chailletii]|nr:hypothetical protein OF83DRAFT_1085520 [Amylostereum chailletii]